MGAKRGIVIGGTGFIGYHAVKELIRRGYEITVLAKDTVSNIDFPKEVQIIIADINELKDEDILQHFGTYDFIVYAAGADDRVIPKKPAYNFFYRENVKSAKRIFALAREAGIKKAILLSSYFCYFNRIWPEKEIGKKHPYIRSRIEQEEECLRLTNGEFELIVLELPYIFGNMPGRKPLWYPLIKYIKSIYPLFYTDGGTNMIAVEHVAEAIAGAIENGNGSRIYTVGDENVLWKDMLNSMMNAMGIKKKIIIIPVFLLKITMFFLRVVHSMKGKESGLEPVAYIDIQTQNTFFNPEEAIKTLGYKTGGLREAIERSIKGCSD